MTSFSHWIASHWVIWTTSGLWGFVGGLLGGTLKWFVPSRKEWAESRQIKRHAKTDAKVLREIRTMCDGNSAIYTTKDIAERIGIDLDEIADSLDRLKNIRRVQMYGIGTTDDPGPGWRSTFR